MDVEVARRFDEIGGSETTSVCTFWLAGRCTKNSCRFLHPETLSPSHEPHLPLILDDERSLAKACRKSSTSSICKYWANGNCMHGDQCHYLHSWCDGIEVKFHEGNPKPTRLAWWTAPPDNFVKINCDGAFSYHQNKTAVGGVVRDSEGRNVISFSGALTIHSTVLECELLAILIGMEIAMSRGFTNLVVESDSYSAIQLINNGESEDQQSHNHHHPWITLASSIRRISKKAEHVHWNHVFRETNSVADGLAKHGMSLSPGLGIKLFESPPPFILIPMCADDAGVTYTR